MADGLSLDPAEFDPGPLAVRGQVHIDSGTNIARVIGLTPGEFAPVTGPVFFGLNVTGPAVPFFMTSTQSTAILNLFTSALKGLVPASGGGTANFLRADGTWAVPPGTGGGGAGWDDVLAVDEHSGAHNAFVDTGQYMNFGTTTPSQTTGNIRASGNLLIHPDTGFEVHAHDAIYIHGPDTITLESTSGGSIDALTSASISLTSTAADVLLNAGVQFRVSTAAITRLTIEADGSWNVGGSNGSDGQYLRSFGGAAPPQWASLALSELPSQAADTFLGRLAGAGTPAVQLLADVGSASIIYDAATHTFQRAAITGDATASQNSNALTISNNAVTNTKANDMPALTVKANATNATADPQDVASAADDTVFRRTATTLNWGQLTVGMAPNDLWTYAKIQNVSATSRILGRITAGAGDIEELTGTQATTLLDVFTSALKGLAPASGGGTTNFLRADGTWAAPLAGHVIQDNNVSETQRANLNFLTTASVIAIVTDDSVNNRSTVTVERAAFTGDVTAAQNSNALTIPNDTVTNAKAANMPAISVKSNPTASSADPQDVAATAVRQVYQVNTGGTALQWGDPNQLYNSSLALQGDWYQFRALDGTHTTSAATVTTRGANVSWSVNLSTLVPAIDSTSVVANGTVLERAGLTGAIAASQNSNATVFAGIRFANAATTDRTNLNFVNGTRMTASLVDDAVNDEIEVTYNWNGFGLYQSDTTTFVKNALDLAPIDGDSIQGVATNPGGNGGGLQYNYTGTTSEITLASATGNLGTINIAALKCGGSYRVSSASSSFSIEGFTAKQVGFWFQFFFDELAGGDECTLFHEDATATATNRLSMPGRKDLTNRGIRGVFIYGGNSRWNFVSPDPAYIGTANNYMRADDGRAAEIATSSTDVNITAGGTASVNISAGNDVNITASAGVGSNGDVLMSGDNLILSGCVPRSDFGTLGGTALATWGPVFVLSRDVTAGTAGAAGDSTFFNADAPFAFRVLLCGCDITTGSGAGDTVTFRNATGGGGLPVCGAMPTAVAGQSIGNSITALAGTGTIPANGTLVARWTDRAAVGTVWALCVRTS